MDREPSLRISATIASNDKPGDGTGGRLHGASYRLSLARGLTVNTYPIAIKGQRSWAAGALLLEGDMLPKDIPLWQCEHRHADVAEAQGCAEAEQRRRERQP